jgi:2'-5' RNA ligase
MNQDLFALSEPPEARGPQPAGPLFLAAVPSADDARRIASLGARVQADHHLEGRLRPPHVLHVTLADLTACPYAEHVVRDAVRVAMGKLRHPAFDVAFDHIQSFDNGNDSAPCVLRGGRGAAELQALQDWLRSNLARVGLDCRRLPAPHMTLLYGPQRLPELLVEPVAWTVNELVLVRSHVGNTHHEVIDRWPMQGRGDTGAALDAWAQLVVKDHVALGGLSRAELERALALAWAALPQDESCSEPQINEHLKSVLQGVGACFATDHVELRRWLVDAGWLQRDGYGREYRVRPWATLPAALQAVAEPLRHVDVSHWVAAQRQAKQAARDARRRDWQARQNAA